MKDKIAELEAENKRLKESINNKIQSHVNTCLARDHRINRLEAELQARESHLNELEKDNAELQAEISHLKADNDILLRRTKEYMDIRNNMEAENAQLKHEFKMERQTGHELIEENARLSALVEEVQLDANGIKTSLMECKKELAALKKELEAKE